MTRKSITLFAAALLLAAGQLSAQCAATLSTTGHCLPTATLTAHSAAQTIDSIKWYDGNTLLQSYKAAFQQYGVTVAGGNGGGTANNQIGGAMKVQVDTAGNIYVLESANHRVTKWAPGATVGITIADKPGAEDFYVDDTGNVYLADGGNGHVWKYTQGFLPTSAVIATVTYACGVCTDRAGNLYVGDIVGGKGGGTFVRKFLPGATTFTTIAGGTQGKGAKEFGPGITLQVMDNGDMYVADYAYSGGSRVQLWYAGVDSGVTVARRTRFIYVDAARNIYGATNTTYTVRLFTPTDTAGIIIAGGNGQGPDKDQFISPYSATPDKYGNVYVADQYEVRKFSRAVIDTLNVTNAGNYYAVVYASGCSATSDTIAISALPVPTITVTHDTTLSVTGTYSTYQWNKDGQPIANATGATYNATQDGNYSVTVTNEGGCSGTSSQEVVTIPNTSIPAVANNIVVCIYPNPAQSIVTVKASVPVSVSISSMEGKQVLQQNHTQQCNISHLAAGIYILRVTDASGNLLRMEKLIKTSK